MELTFTTAEWDHYAKCYDTLNQLRPYNDLLATVHNLIPENSKSILDVGCGTGNLLIKCQVSHPNARLVGVDQSAAMLLRASRKTSGIELVEATLSDKALLFASQMDTVVSCNVLYATDEPHLFLRQIRQCLSPGGIFVIATPKKGFENGLILKAHCRDRRPDSFWANAHSSKERENFLLKEAFGDTELAQAMHTIANFGRKIVRESSFHFYSDQQLIELCGESGLRVDSLTHSYGQQTQVVSGKGI